MTTVVLGNLRWEVLSPSLYRLMCPATSYPIVLGYSGEAWYLSGHDIVVTVPDRDTGAQLLAKQLNKQQASNRQTMDPDDEDEIAGDPDDPDNYLDEAEDKETTDNERADHEGVPTVDIAPAPDDGDAGCGP
jgi:hypothetical protein